MTKTQRIVNTMVERIRSCAGLADYTVNTDEQLTATTKTINVQPLDLTPTLDWRRGTTNTPMGTTRFAIRIATGVEVGKPEHIAPIVLAAILADPTMGRLCLPVTSRQANTVAVAALPTECVALVVEARWLVDLSNPDSF